MPTHIALLRGINVGGNKQIPMAELKKRCELLGFANVRTLLATGNVIFESPREDSAILKAQLEAEIAAAFGCTSVVFMRTPDELRAVVAACPFGEAERAQGSQLLVTFLLEPPSQASIDSLRNAYTDSEVIHVVGREAYIFFPEGMGRSKLGNPQLERRLGVLGTGRNWNTVLKLAAMLKG